MIIRCKHCNEGINTHCRVESTCPECGKPYGRDVVMVAKANDPTTITLCAGSSHGYQGMLHNPRMASVDGEPLMWGHHHLYMDKDNNLYRVV